MSAPAASRDIQSYIDAGDYNTAYSELLDDYGKRPDDPRILFHLGLCAPSGNMSSVYLKDFLQKHANSDFAPEAMGLLMDYYSSAGLLITAGNLTESVNSDEFASPAFQYKAALYKQHLGKYKLASKIYGDLERSKDPEYSIWAQLGLSDCSLLQGDYNSALSGYKNLVDKSSDSPVFPFALIGISETYRRLGDIDKAQVFYELYREKFESSPRDIEIEAAMAEKRSSGDESRLHSLIDVDYYIQVGVFARKSNAEICLKEFRNLRYSARMVDFREGGKLFYRVLVGPYGSESEAQNAKNDLERSRGEKYTLFIQ
jgi:tetratricopeptide (TPR) repeat protein